MHFYEIMAIQNLIYFFMLITTLLFSSIVLIASILKVQATCWNESIRAILNKILTLSQTILFSCDICKRFMLLIGLVRLKN